MITAEHLSKSFGSIKAVNNIDLTIADGEVFGLVGTNGAGKSTFLRILAGIYRQDNGTLAVDGMPVYENVEAKEKLFYVSDEQFFYPNATPAEMIDVYAAFYPAFDRAAAEKLFHDFGLDKDRRIKTFSKGMKKQVSLLCGIASGAKYLLLDETFDGLDPVMRQAAKTLIAEKLVDRGMTPVIASHNLRELEDICDHVGILHQGGILLSQDLLSLRTNLHRVQCVLKEGQQLSDIEGLTVRSEESRGKVKILTLTGEEEAIRAAFEKADPVFYDILPLSLEEIFISETEANGYDVRSILF